MRRRFNPAWLLWLLLIPAGIAAWIWLAPPSYLDPGRLWVLAAIPVLVAAYIWAMTRRNKQGMRFPNTTLLSRVVPKQSQWRRHLAVALSLLSLVTLTIAWARPNGVDYVPRERATIVLVLDTSMSMGATDVEPNRLDAAKQAALTFVAALPAQYNVAVVALAGNSRILSPPVTDRAATKQAINSLKLANSTAIGESIYLALTALQMAPKGTDDTPAPGAVVMLSDGTNTAGRAPLQAAAEAKKQNVPIYTIAYGTDLGHVDLPAEGDQPASRELVPPDRTLMAAIAQATGGTTFSASDLGQLDAVYRNLSSEVGRMPVNKEVTATWAGYGLAFAVVAALAAVSLGARWPS